MKCFNPCFIGSSSTTCRHSMISPPGMPVSILVLLDLPLQLEKEEEEETASRVSILVLLDLPLQLREAIERKIETTAFQSLFYWIFLYNLGRNPRRRANVRVSISLFYWIFLYNTKPERRLE